MVRVREEALYPLLLVRPADPLCRFFGQSEEVCQIRGTRHIGLPRFSQPLGRKDPDCTPGGRGLTKQALVLGFAGGP